MESIRWDSLLDDSIKERVVEQWLWNADIAFEVTSGTADLDLILRSIFGCLREFQKSREIQCRCYQLLQDLYTLARKSIDVNEAGLSYMTITEDSLRNWAGHADVVSGCFQFISMTFEKEHDNITDLVSNDLIERVCAALSTHRHSKRVQQPGIQIFYHLLLQSITGSVVITDETLHKMIQHVIYNLRFMNDDLGIVKVCCSALDTVVRKIAPNTFSLLIDELVVLVAELFRRYYKESEIASACLLILEKLVVEERHMMTFCSSSDLLFEICDSIDFLKYETKYNLSVVAAFHLFNQALSDHHLLSFILDDEAQSRYDFISKLKGRLLQHVGDSGLYSQHMNMNLSPALQSKLDVLAKEVFYEINNILAIEIKNGASADIPLSLDIEPSLPSSLPSSSVQKVETLTSSSRILNDSNVDKISTDRGSDSNTNSKTYTNGSANGNVSTDVSTNADDIRSVDSSSCAGSRTGTGTGNHCDTSISPAVYHEDDLDDVLSNLCYNEGDGDDDDDDDGLSIQGTENSSVRKVDNATSKDNNANKNENCNSNDNNNDNSNNNYFDNSRTPGQGQGPCVSHEESSSSSRISVDEREIAVAREKEKEKEKANMINNMNKNMQTNFIVEVAQLSQHQTLVAMVRADILHKLFKDATKKIEVLYSAVLMSTFI